MSDQSVHAYSDIFASPFGHSRPEADVQLTVNATEVE